MEFRMSDIPMTDLKVAGAVVRCLQKCDRALNEALIETQDIMPESDWKLLRHGVGQILGSDMFDLWVAVVKLHPQFKHEAFGE
jgi:hypothetical protein